MFAQCMRIDSRSSKTAGLRRHVDCVCLFNVQSMIDAGCKIRQAPNVTLSVQEVVGTQHLQATNYELDPTSRYCEQGSFSYVRPDGFLRSIFWRCHLGHP